MVNLWKRESSVRDTNYCDLFSHLGNGQYEHLSRELQQGKTEKSTDVSIAYRLQGNDLFRENKIAQAMELYNKSLCFAEIGTENVSLVYANRSSCFLALKMYEEALIDIELAVKAKYPDRLMAKLMRRQATCLRLMEAEPQRKRFQPKLSFQSHDRYPCLANSLEMKCNQKFGRHIVATRDIEVDKMILVERNFASVSIDDERMSCAKCMKTKANFIACSMCTDAMYCCIDCMQRDATHKMTCGQFNGVDGSMKLYIQTVFIAISLFKNVDNLMEFVEEALKSNGIQESMMDAKSQYRLFLSIQPSINEHDKDDLMFDAQKIYIILQSTPTIKILFGSVAKQRFLQHLVLHHLLVTVRNRFQVSADGDHLKTTEIASITCIFNHSCYPNAFNHVIDNQSVLITIRPVEKGEQLFISYLGEETEKSTDFRRMSLMNDFGFFCECDKCVPRCSRSDRVAMEMDSYFKYIKQNYKIAFDEKVRRIALKEVCIRFLNKYGHLPWSDELNLVTFCYVKWFFEYSTVDY
ncbi:SET and MYND domain-containing protein 4-like [Sitodiplosis mosellana]|uniref:SET and MYND domain-containing protein 4-like n=1 Tax=Sitodiplosis mosellana TaxID=263140 RepID=UPI0024452AFD|nr:SET and MYND domain-containing protein 4-like [Sitodiplosis mosellana]